MKCLFLLFTKDYTYGWRKDQHAVYGLVLDHYTTRAKIQPRISQIEILLQESRYILCRVDRSSRDSLWNKRKVFLFA